MKYTSFLFTSILLAVFLLIPSSFTQACAKPLFQPAAAAAASASEIKLSQEIKNGKLITAVIANKIDDVTHWLNHGANINARSKYNNTPLMLAATKGYESIARLLLSYQSPDGTKVDINARNNNQETALIFACDADKENEEIVGLLLDHRSHDGTTVDINARDSDQGAALIHATFNGHAKIVGLLLNHISHDGIGIDINARNNGHVNALMIAADRGHELIVRSLLYHRSLDGTGVNMNDEGLNGYTALRYATLRARTQIIRLLLTSHYIQQDHSPTTRQTNLEILRKVQNEPSLYPERLSLIGEMIPKSIQAIEANDPEILLSTLTSAERADYEAMMKEQRENSLAVFTRKTIGAVPATMSVTTMLARREARLTHTHRKFIPQSTTGPAGSPSALPVAAATAAAARPDLIDNRVDKPSTLLLEMDT